VAINCGAIPENLLESELFGHVKGAFTGAVSNRVGLGEEADGGTLFLDEITELPPQLQVKLLRFIQERSIRRVGGTTDIPVDIRLIAATNGDVEELMASGGFREDLFYRLNVIRITLPPLRERTEDIPLLAGFFLEKFSAEHGKQITRFSEEAMKLLMGHGYSGNVRELENMIERAVTLETTDAITAGSLPEGLVGAHAGSPGLKCVEPVLERVRGNGGGIDLDKTVEEFKRAGGVKKKAAELLGLSFRSMRYKLSKYGISEN
jgi:two-component system response regulator PilR (NtrC family)